MRSASWRIAGVLASTGAAAGAIALLFVWGELSVSDLASRVRAIDLPFLLFILAGTAVQMVCGAVKWRLVLHRMAPESTENTGLPFFLFYTCLASVLAQLVTVYLASILVRSLAARLHQRLPIVRGAVSSGFEQMLDVYALCLFVVPTLIVLFAGLSLGAWIVLTVIILCIGHLALGWAAEAAEGLRIFFLRGLGMPQFSARLAAILESAQHAGMLSTCFLRQLFALAAVRYSAMLFRTLAILLGATFLFPLADIIYGHTVAQASQIAAFTPGNLGIAEWSWTGLLSLRGQSLETAAEFAVVVRIMSVASMVVVFLMSALMFAITYGARLRNKSLERKGTCL